MTNFYLKKVIFAITPNHPQITQITFPKPSPSGNHSNPKTPPWCFPYPTLAPPCGSKLLGTTVREHTPRCGRKCDWLWSFLAMSIRKRWIRLRLACIWVRSYAKCWYLTCIEFFVEMCYREIFFLIEKLL